VEGSGRVVTEVLLQYLPRGTYENHEKSQSVGVTTESRTEYLKYIKATSVIIWTKLFYIYDVSITLKVTIIPALGLSVGIISSGEKSIYQILLTQVHIVDVFVIFKVKEKSLMCTGVNKTF
jgi:hypothetical protein